MNRETWLIQAVDRLRPLFKQSGYTVPVVKVSVGFPGGGSAKKRIGEHWSPEASDDEIGSIFISPILADGLKAIDVLVHELVHASVGNKVGHGKVFKQCATAVGLVGKMRSASAGPELLIKLKLMIDELGQYPHAALNLNMGKKKQTTRMVKQECSGCGYIVRSSRASIEQFGAVICPSCNNQMEY